MSAAAQLGYQIPLTKRSICRMATHKCWSRAAQVFKAQEALQQMAVITAAIGGKKANKLIGCWRSRQKW